MIEISGKLGEGEYELTVRLVGKECLLQDLAMEIQGSLRHLRIRDATRPQPCGCKDTDATERTSRRA